MYAFTFPVCEQDSMEVKRIKAQKHNLEKRTRLAAEADAFANEGRRRKELRLQKERDARLKKMRDQSRLRTKQINAALTMQVRICTESIACI